MPCGIAGHSGSLHGTEIPRKSATRLVWEEEGVRAGLLLQSKQARIRLQAQIQQRGVEFQRQDRAFSRQWAAQEAGDGGGGCSSPVALGQAFLYLSLSLCVPLSRSLLLSLSLLFRSVNVRSRSLVSGNDLTQQTKSSSRAKQRGEMRRGGATSPPPGSKQPQRVSLFPLFFFFFLFQTSP